MMYRVTEYPPDGGGAGEIVVCYTESLKESLAVVRRELRVQRIHSCRRWTPDDHEDGWRTIVGFHEHPPHHPAALGCGGFCVERRGL